MKFSNMSKEELEELIKSGKAKKIHLTTIEKVLKPRGPLEKESLSLYILEKLVYSCKSWTDPSYSDNPDLGTLVYNLKKNLDDETSAAWKMILKLINSPLPIEEAWLEFLRSDKTGY